MISFTFHYKFPFNVNIAVIRCGEERKEGFRSFPLFVCFFFYSFKIQLRQKKEVNNHRHSILYTLSYTLLTGFPAKFFTLTPSRVRLRHASVVILSLSDYYIFIFFLLYHKCTRVHEYLLTQILTYI